MLREPNQANRSTKKDKQTLTESLAMSCARSTFQYNRLVKGTRQDGTALQEEPLNLIYVDTHQSIQAGKALQILFKCQPGAEQTRQKTFSSRRQELGPFFAFCQQPLLTLGPVMLSYRINESTSVWQASFKSCEFCKRITSKLGLFALQRRT